MPGPAQRYAVVRFENLSGNSSFDWTGRASSEILSFTLAGALDGPVLSPAALGRLVPILGGRPPSAPGISGERAQALLAGATRLISGYVEAPYGNARIVAVEEDLRSGKTLRTVSAQNATTAGALSALSRELSPRSKRYLVSDSEAIRHYFTGLEAPLNASRAELEQAIHLEPDFGPAWLALTRLSALRGDRAQAATWIVSARSRKLDPLTLASLDLESALLEGDQTARIEALRKVAALSPGDAVLMRSLAESETTAGQFAAAAADWSKITASVPDDAASWNSLAYSRSLAGDYPGALKALDEYRRLRPNEANPLDSAGDVQYSYRKFTEATANYLQANARDPSFLRSGELYKAAWAKFNAGERAAADSLFAQFRAAREKSSDPLIALFAADWLYRTGRQPEAVKFLRRVVKDASSAALRADGFSQLAVWDLLAGDRTKALVDATASGAPVSVPVVLTRFAAQPSASAKDWEARAERAFPAPSMASLRRLALGFALLLDTKRDAALPVWADIVAHSPASDSFNRAIYNRLRGKQPEHPLLPDPNSLNQFVALLDIL